MGSESREALIEKLLATSHLNAVERSAFLTSPIAFQEALTAARSLFVNCSFIPATIDSWQDDKPSYDGFCLEQKEGTFVLHHQVHGSKLDIRHSHSQSFNSLQLALQLYLQMGFEYMIDGVTIGKPEDE